MNIEARWTLADVNRGANTWVLTVELRMDGKPVDSLVPHYQMSSLPRALRERTEEMIQEIRELLGIERRVPALMSDDPDELAHVLGTWDGVDRSADLEYQRAPDLGSDSERVQRSMISPRSENTLRALDWWVHEEAIRGYNVRTILESGGAAFPEPARVLSEPMHLHNRGGQYKSIGRFEWREIPPLAVLTGVNGSGKSHLLELIYRHLRGALDAYSPEIRLDSGPLPILPAEVVLVSSDMAVADVAVLDPTEYMRQVERTFEAVHSDVHSGRFDQLLAEMNRRAGFMVESVSLDEFQRYLPPDFAMYPAADNVLEGLTTAFLQYRMSMFNLWEHEHLSGEAIRQRLGAPPWEVLNEVLAATQFRYRVISPEGTTLISRYTLRLRAEDGTELLPSELSSGEKVILSLVMWLYRSKHYNRFPKLLLLDEPDAHLHPSLTRDFLDAIRTVLVERYGVRVILTTHSPSTVALAPEGSVFEMRRNEPRITRAASQAKTVALLTAGLIAVGPSTRYVLVEDEDDSRFYSEVDELIREAAARDDTLDYALAPGVAFVPASTGRGATKTGGGKNQVGGWLTKLQQVGLDAVFQGLIDRDDANASGPGLHVLSRYSLENYLLDPIVVFAALAAHERAPAVAGITVRAGDEHTLRDRAPEELQRIADVVFSAIQPHLGTLDKAETELTDVTFIGGPTLRYPKWLLQRQGKALQQRIQAAFSAHPVIYPAGLLPSFRRVRLVPDEFIGLFNAIRAHAP